MSALDDQVRDALSRVLESLRERLETELSTCQDDVLRAAQEAGTRIAVEASEQATLEARRDAEVQLSELRSAAERDLDEHRARSTGEIESLQRRLEESQADSQSRLQGAERQIEESRQQLESSRQELDAVRQEFASVRQLLDGEIEIAREANEATSRELALAQQQVESLQRDLESAHHAEQELRMAAAYLERLRQSIRVLDEAASFSELLDRLAEEGCRAAGRAAVFLVKENRLRDWRVLGFEPPLTERLDVGLDQSSVMAEAVRTGSGVYNDKQDAPALPGFARNHTTRRAGAWPVAVAGSVVAILYADAPVADKREEGDWPAVLEVLALHAGRVLEGITMRQAAGLVAGQVPRSHPPSVGPQPAGSIQ